MIRSKLWFRCAAMHDPVTPVIVRPALVGWDAKNRKVDLTIERGFKGDELVMRMKGWVTTDVKKVVEVIRKHGFLKVMDERDLVVETETEQDYENLAEDFRKVFWRSDQPGKDMRPRHGRGRDCTPDRWRAGSPCLSPR